MTKKTYRDVLLASIKSATCWEGVMEDGNNIVYWSACCVNTALFNEKGEKTGFIMRNRKDNTERVVMYDKPWSL